MSWQQALQDKGCESRSQGTKEDKLPKRQALAPKRDREAPEAGGAMNVENTGKRRSAHHLSAHPAALVPDGRTDGAGSQLAGALPLGCRPGHLTRT